MVNNIKNHIETTSPEHCISQRRVLKVTGVSSSTYRYCSKQEGKDMALTKAIYSIVEKKPRYGYRKVAAVLRRDNWDVGTGRVYRLWRKEGLKVSKKLKKHITTGSSANACTAIEATCKDEVWSMDFVHDSTANGSSLRFLTIIDEYTRESLSAEVGTSFSGSKVAETLRRLFIYRAVPKYIRTDNGKEFTCKLLKRLFNLTDCKHLLIKPGSPWQNGYCESFNNIFRDDFLNMHIFSSPKEARRLLQIWKDEYNNFRPHGSLGQKQPALFAQSLSLENGSATLHPSQERGMLCC